jgi:peroxiredoxin Q/BCP
MKKSIVAALALSVLGLASATAGPKAAQVDPPYAAPVLEATDHEGKTLKFADLYKDNKYVLVYFYPKADTPGCTKQGCSLRDGNAELAKQGVKIVGVSADSVEAQKAFVDKYSFPFPLIADKDGKVIDAFKVAKRPNGMASREAFLIKEGKVVWHDPQASTEKQAEDALQAIKDIK